MREPGFISTIYCSTFCFELQRHTMTCREDQKRGRDDADFGQDRWNDVFVPTPTNPNISVRIGRFLRTR